MSEAKHGILDEEIPDVQFVAKPYSGPYPPVAQFTRWHLLKAAKRLKVDESLWGKIDLKAVPTGFGMRLGGPDVGLPDFDVMKDTPKKWKERAQGAFEEACDKYLKYVDGQRKSLIASRRIFAVKQSRNGGNNAPLSLRYDWAVQRFLLDLDYKEMAEPPYKATQVKQAVREILKQADLSAK